ncbi:phage tail fiber protein [Acinetobacter sp. NigerLNRRAM0016]
MTKQTVSLGTAPTGAGGDTFRSAASKLQANDNELYAALGGASGTLPAALPIANGGTGATTAPAARTALNLGTAATATMTVSGKDTTSGRVIKVGDFGLGISLSIDDLGLGTAMPSGFYAGGSVSANDTANSIGTFSAFIHTTRRQESTQQEHSWQFGKNQTVNDMKYRFNTTGTWSSWYTFNTTRNTTIDANGFIKAASPIVQLFADRIELNDEAQLQEITFEKLAVGDYLIGGTSGFAQEGWYVETPKDANGNVLFSVIYDTLENGDISVKTYKKKFDLETASIVADLSQPVDITPGRWIDLRLQEIPVEELELLESSTPPDFQPTNLSQAVAEAMVTYDGTE